MNFWDRLVKPFFVLAPMADVTDPAFRRIIATYGKPDVLWTEFVSADGLAYAPEEGRKKLLADLIFDESERPIVAQFFTGRPESMEKAAALAMELEFDGIDINMGCPDGSVEKQKAGASLIKDPTRAKEIIAAAIRGAPTLPVSVKTRTGYNKDELDSWIPSILETGITALTIHARTRKEMSAVPAHWDALPRVVALRDKLNPGVLVLGNGDVKDVSDARQKTEEFGVDGVMLGRAIFGNPWLFSKEGEPVSIGERLRVMVEHTKLYEELLPHKSFAIMRKHYKAYVNGFPGAAELRGELMNAPNTKAVEELVSTFVSVL